MSSVRRALDEITDQLATMRRRAAAPEAELMRTAPNVSAWCPAQHLDHLAKTSTSILRRLAAPTPVTRGITPLGRVLLRLGWIPRGRGKAPERLHGACVSSGELLASLDAMEALLKSADVSALEASRMPVIPHPSFGGLTPAQALRFASIHNAHHLKIVDEIARA